MKIRFTGLVLLVFISALTTKVDAQCINTSSASCNIYQSCFAKLCPCQDSEYEYFISYGKKYCEVFLDLPGLSPQGIEWRNSTLKCLQEALLTYLPPFGEEASCNCKAIQLKAFESHVSCYTKPGHSICDLPAEDWLLIYNATDPVANLVDQKRRKQIVEVALKCAPGVAGRVKTYIDAIIDKLERNQH